MWPGFCHIYTFIFPYRIFHPVFVTLHLLSLFHREKPVTRYLSHIKSLYSKALYRLSYFTRNLSHFNIKDWHSLHPDSVIFHFKKKKALSQKFTSAFIIHVKFFINATRFLSHINSLYSKALYRLSYFTRNLSHLEIKDCHSLHPVFVIFLLK